MEKRRVKAVSDFGDERFAIVDIDGRLVFVSSRLCAFHGRPPRAITETKWPDLIHPDDIDYVRVFLATAYREQRTFAGWWRIHRHDGAFVWAMVCGSPLRSQLSDAPVAYMCTVDPLTHHDAFRCAGGMIEPGRPFDSEPSSRLSRLERLADLTLMASALAREMGEADIAAALDGPLEQIGFRLAGLTEPPSPPGPVNLEASFQRAPRPVRTVRRRLASRS